MKYEHKSIEKKWQDKWEDAGVFHATNDYSKPKFYALVEFPYPSGAGLHVGHPRSYTALDIVARKRRMQGYNVLYPMGWDAFGLPAENYAIKNHVHPEKFTRDNIQNFKHQLQSLGLSFDWSREVATIDPGYYKWTQWIFQQLFKKGLAYKASMPVNWCTSCKCVLANEEVVNGVCERCGSPVVRKEKSQWMLAITKYAQRLIDDLDEVNFIDRVKTQQTNWIGRSEGAEVDFTATTGETLTVFTTRADTLFGVTYMVMSPEHPYLKQWKDKISNWNEVVAYQQAAARKSDFERTEMAKDKTGVKLEGVAAINPVNKKEIPIFVSDYVLMGYGTGAIMAVPGHDDRDWEFAKKFGLDIIEVVSGGDVTKAAFTSKDENAIMVNSDFLNGKTVKEAIPYMKDWVEAQGFGRKKVNFKLRDWVFSRQRYWGEPIPLVYCEKCGWVPVPEEELPLKLPEVQSYEPTDNGESPLAKCTDWINTTCPCCGAPAKRETDTMPQWAGSSWYFLRYMDPNNDQALVGKEAIAYWNQVDWYNGGMEHTTLHLLYSRFWHKFLYDIGVVPTSEPYAKRTSHGMILGLNPRCYDNMSDEDKAKLLAEHGDEAGARKYLLEQYGEMTEHPIVKMSKSLNNVVNPDDIVEEYGADTMRLYEMFLGDFEKAAPWDPKAIKGCRRFLDRIWNLAENLKEGDELSHANEAALHKTLKKVGDDAENLKANTAIAAMMGLLNQLEKNGCNKAEFKMFITMLNPFAPHMTEELNEQLYGGKMLAQTEWPVYDESKTVDATVEIAVQINGKVRSVITIAADADEKAIEEQALADSKIQAAMAGMQVVKAIVIKKKIVNFVVKPL